MKFCAVVALLILSGCATVGERAYSPAKSREKKAFVRADRSIAPLTVQTNFDAFLDAEVAWAGIITDVQYNETERTVQVAFEVEHRGFDWINHGGKRPFQLGAKGDGMFRTGWEVDKPTRISYLKLLAAPGDMIIVYGKPYRMKEGVVQLAATALRPIKEERFSIRETVVDDAFEPDRPTTVPSAGSEIHHHALEILESMDASTVP
jgi:hypothetical protein